MSSSIQSLHELHYLLCLLLEHPIRAESSRLKKAVFRIHRLPPKVPDTALEDDIRLCTPGKQVLLQILVFCVKGDFISMSTPVDLAVNLYPHTLSLFSNLNTQVRVPVSDVPKFVAGSSGSTSEDCLWITRGELTAVSANGA